MRKPPKQSTGKKAKTQQAAKPGVLSAKTWKVVKKVVVIAIQLWSIFSKIDW